LSTIPEKEKHATSVWEIYVIDASRTQIWWVSTHVTTAESGSVQIALIVINAMVVRGVAVVESVQPGALHAVPIIASYVHLLKFANTAEKHIVAVLLLIGSMGVVGMNVLAATRNFVQNAKWWHCVNIAVKPVAGIVGTVGEEMSRAVFATTK
jgi:hypothetical protein